MNDFFRNNGLWLLLVAAVLSALLAAASLTGASSSIPENAVNVLATPFRAATTYIAKLPLERIMKKLIHISSQALPYSATVPLKMP